MKLITKLLLIVLGAVTGMVLVGGFAVTSLHRTMLQERQQSMELLVRMAAHQVAHFIELEKSGKLSREDAQAAAKDVLRSLRDGENYIFVRGGEKLLMMIVHPDSRREGLESNGGVLASGLSLTEVYLQALQNGNGNSAFVSVMTNRPNGNVLLPKISAVQRIPEWNWLIGSGDFVDDIDKTFWSYVFEFLIIGGSVLVGVVVLAFVLARGILKQLGGEPQDAAELLRNIAEGDLSVEIILKEDDNNSLMSSLRRMQMKLKNITSSIHDNTSSLNEQIQIFTATTNAYIQSKSDVDLVRLHQSIKLLSRIAETLGNSVSRFKL